MTLQGGSEASMRGRAEFDSPLDTLIYVFKPSYGEGARPICCSGPWSNRSRLRPGATAEAGGSAPVSTWLQGARRSLCGSASQQGAASEER